MRPNRTRAADYPGTRKKVGDKCSVCYERNPLRGTGGRRPTDEELAKREKQRQTMRCGVCKRKMRPVSAKAADYPGTVKQQVTGKCNTCYMRGGISGNSFVEDPMIETLNRLPVPDVGEKEYRIVRRLIEDRFEGDDYLLSVLGLVGEDIE